LFNNNNNSYRWFRDAGSYGEGAGRRQRQAAASDHCRGDQSARQSHCRSASQRLIYIENTNKNYTKAFIVVYNDAMSLMST
jgi:hypothetical protein